MSNPFTITAAALGVPLGAAFAIVGVAAAIAGGYGVVTPLDVFYHLLPTG